MHRKEKKRITISFALSLLVHVVFFIGLGLFVSFKSSENIKSLGPVFVQLESDFVKPPEEQDEEPAPEYNQPEPEELKPIEPQKPDEGKVAQNVKPREPEEKPVVEKEDPLIPAVEVEENPEISHETDVSENSLPEATQVRATSAPKPTDAPTPTEAPTATGTPTPTPKPTDEPSALNWDDLNLLDETLAEGPDGPANDTGETSTTDNQANKSVSSNDTSGPQFSWEDQKARGILKQPEVKLPDWVYERGLSLFVRLKFDLMPDGNLTNITVDQTSGYTDVDEAVITALRQYLIEPSKTKEIISGVVSFPITPK